MGDVFDMDLTGSDAHATIRPFWTCAYKQDEEAKKWLDTTFKTLCTRARWRTDMYRKLMGLYKGQHYTEDKAHLNAEAKLSYYNVPRQKVAKIVINHLYDFTEQRVSRLTRYKPAVIVDPASTDSSDRVSAKIAKIWLDYVSYVNNFDMLLQELARATMIFGQSFLQTKWNPNKGDVHPDWKEEMKQARRDKREARLPLVDENGKQIVTDGVPQWIDHPIRVGEVEFNHVTAPYIFLEERDRFDHADYYFQVMYLDIDWVRNTYADKALDITNKQSGSFYNWDTMQEEPLGNKVMVIDFYHRSTEFIGEGRYCRFIPDGPVLENKPYPFRHGQLNLIRFADIEAPNHMHGISFYMNGKAMNSLINDLTSMIRRNQMLMAHPKWMVPAGSVQKKESLGNDASIVEFRGPMAPAVVTAPVTPKEVFDFRDTIKEDMQTIMGVFDVSRGQVPKRIDSALALQYLDEQENERANSTVSKFYAVIKDSFLQALDIASLYYTVEDHRLLQLIGRDQAGLLDNFDPAHLAKPVSIRIQNSSALPNSKAARTQTIIELSKQFPTLVTPNQVVDMLELGETDKFYDATTLAIRSAESEEEYFMLGEKVDPPDAAEDLIVHHQTHLRRWQNRSFKDQAPSIRKGLKDHIMATEMQMFDRARINPVFAQQAAALPNFPVFFNPSDTDLMALGRPARIPDVEAPKAPQPPANPSPPAQPQQGPQSGPAGSPGMSPEPMDSAGRPMTSAAPPPLPNGEPVAQT